MATYQTRICDYWGMERVDGGAALSAYAELYGQVERKLFVAVAAGRAAAPLKSDYLKRYGIPARMFNGVRVSLEGKVAAVREQQKARVDGLRGRVIQAEKQIQRAVQQGRRLRRITSDDGSPAGGIGWRPWKPMCRRDECDCASGQRDCGTGNMI